MRDGAWIWQCVCGLRGTLAFDRVPADADREPAFYCPGCRQRLENCRPTRRARAAPGEAEIAPSIVDAGPLTDEDLVRSVKDWELTQQQIGKLGVLAESNWALDWAERLLAEICRLRQEDTLPARRSR